MTNEQIFEQKPFTDSVVREMFRDFCEICIIKKYDMRGMLLQLEKKITSRMKDSAELPGNNDEFAKMVLGGLALNQIIGYYEENLKKQ